MALVKEFNSESLILRGADELALIVVDIEVLAGIDQSEELGTLNDHVDGVLYIENEWRAPVLGDNVVYITLISGTNYHESVLDAHIDNSFPVVKVLVHLIEHIVHVDFVVLVQHCLNV